MGFSQDLRYAPIHGRWFGRRGAGRPSDAIVEKPSKPRLRGVSHEVAAFVFPVMGLGAVLVARSVTEKLAVAVYAIGVSGMYATSACYHRVNWAPVTKTRMRRLDHSMILVAIASTYTPIAVIALPEATARRLLAAVWGFAVAGVLVCNLWPSAPRWVMGGGSDMGVGWTALLVLPSLLAGLGGDPLRLVSRRWGGLLDRGVGFEPALAGIRYRRCSATTRCSMLWC